MKKLIYCSIAFAALTLSSCKKSKKDDIFNLPYSNLSVEQQKQQIEQSGINFVNQINTLPDEKSVVALNNLFNLEFTENLPALNSLEEITISSSKKNVQGVFNATKEKQSSAEKLIDNYGIYNWDAQNGEWVKTPSNSRLEFKYPATDTSKTNNAVLTITYTSSNKFIEDEYGDSKELPATVNSTLKVDDKEEFRYSSSYEYKDNGSPTKINMYLLIGVFNFKYNFTNTSTNLKTTFSLTKSTETLAAWEINVNGNLTLNLEEEQIPELNNANAYFQLMNIKIAGKADIKAIRASEANFAQLEGDAYNKKYAETLNKNTSLVAINTDENKLMAKAEFFADPQLSTRLVFKDGSKQTFNQFIDNGFDNFLDEIEDLEN